MPVQREYGSITHGAGYTMDISRGCIFLLLSVSLCLGCVSHTERVPYRPYLTQQDTGVWAEVKRGVWLAAVAQNKQAEKKTGVVLYKNGPQRHRLVDG